MRVMSHYLGHVIKWGKCVIIESDCQFSGPLQSPGNWTASQKDRMTWERAEMLLICEFTFFSNSCGNEGFFLKSKISLEVFEDNHPGDRSLCKLQGVSMLNP